MLTELQIRLADSRQISDIIHFQQKYLLPGNSSIYSSEFLCPKGVKAAVFQGQMIVALQNNKIIGIVRFYKSKRYDIISLYQFAIDPAFRGIGLLGEMLKLIHNKDIVSRCPKASEFNEYYKKTGWLCKYEDPGFNHWLFWGSPNRA